MKTLLYAALGCLVGGYVGWEVPHHLSGPLFARLEGLATIPAGMLIGTILGAISAPKE